MSLPAPCPTRAQIAEIYQQSINLQASYVDALSNLIAIGRRSWTDKQN